MRIAIRLVVAWTMAALVACGGADDAVPVAERFPTEAEAPETTADPVEERQTPEDLDEFITAFTPALIDPDQEEMTTVFEDAGFERAGLDVRFFGDDHESIPHPPHLFSWFIELGSEDGAADVLGWIEADTMKPCPESCAVTFGSFDVDGIPGARGVSRIATEESIEAAGTEDEVPSESYWIGFTDGSIVYTVDLNGSPGSVSEEQAESIVMAFHDRVTGE
jgi:hypothetical protein